MPASSGHSLALHARLEPPDCGFPAPAAQVHKALAHRGRRRAARPLGLPKRRRGRRRRGRRRRGRRRAAWWGRWRASRRGRPGPATRRRRRPRRAFRQLRRRGPWPGCVLGLEAPAAWALLRGLLPLLALQPRLGCWGWLGLGPPRVIIQELRVQVGLLLAHGGLPPGQVVDQDCLQAPLQPVCWRLRAPCGRQERQSQEQERRSHPHGGLQGITAGACLEAQLPLKTLLCKLEGLKTRVAGGFPTRDRSKSVVKGEDHPRLHAAAAALFQQ
jgi:hypothetical protein